MKMMDGWSFRAREKRAATSLFDSPNLVAVNRQLQALSAPRVSDCTYHLSVRVETCMLMKVAPDSRAKACRKDKSACCSIYESCRLKMTFANIVCVARRSTVSAVQVENGKRLQTHLSATRRTVQ